MNNRAPAFFNPLTATFAYYATYISLGATMALSGPALRWLAQHTNSSLDQISLIFIAASLGYMTGSQLGGQAYDRFPGHRIQALALFMIALGAGLVPVLQSRWLLVAILFLLGIFQGALDTGCNTLLTWIHREKVGPFMNGLHFFFGVGSFVAPLIFAKVIATFGEIHWVYWFFSLLTIPIAIWFWFLPSPPIRKKTAETAGVASRNGLFLLVVFFFIFTVGLELGFGNWINTYSFRLNLANETGAAYLTSGFWGAFSIGRLLGVPISSRLRSQIILLGDLLGCLAAFTIILIWPSSSQALWVGTLLMGLSIASVFATGMTFASHQLKLTGTMIGWILVGGGIGGMVAPWLIGQLFDSIGPHVTMPVLLANNLIALCLLLLLVLPLRKSSSPR